MAENDVVTRETALKALRAKKLEVYPDTDSEYVTIVPPDNSLTGPECIPIPEILGNKLVRYLWRKYGIPIHWFWNPSKIPTEEKPETIQ